MKPNHHPSLSQTCLLGQRLQSACRGTRHQWPIFPSALRYPNIYLQPVSLSLLIALDRRRTQPRNPAPCFLWIFLWFHTLMVMESAFPMYLRGGKIRKKYYKSISEKRGVIFHTGITRQSNTAGGQEQVQGKTRTKEASFNPQGIGEEK